MSEEEKVTKSSFDSAIELIESGEVVPDPNAPSCEKYRLRPSEEAALLVKQFESPPAAWGLKISLAQSFMGAEKCIHIGRKLILNKTVTFLDLSMCDLRDGAPTFFSLLEKNKTLRHLSVNGNYIEDDGAVAASTSLSRLETLHIASNGITDKGAKVLAAALRASSTLKVLNIRNNSITLPGLLAFLLALEPGEENLPEELKKHLPEIQQENKLEVDGAKEEGSMRESGEIEENDFKFNEPVNETTVGEKPAAPEVKNNTILHTLWIEGNKGVTDALKEALNNILAKRVPQLPKSAGTKAKKNKKGNK